MRLIKQFAITDAKNKYGTYVFIDYLQEVINLADNQYLRKERNSLKNKSSMMLLSDSDLYRLILSDPTVYGFDLERKQVKAVFDAYSRIVKDAYEIDIRVPIPNIGEFYPSYRNYKGGYIFQAKRYAPPSVKKRLGFNLSHSKFGKPIDIPISESGEKDE